MNTSPQPTDLNEQALLDALAEIRNWKTRLQPRQMIVSEAGIAMQARNFKEGIITEADMKAVGVPLALIEEVKRIVVELPPVVK